MNIKLDLRSFNGLNINFSSYLSNVYINFTYVNNEEYGGNDFNFDYKTFPSFVPIPDSLETNKLKIGTISSPLSKVVFYPNGEKFTHLEFKSLDISTEALTNISSLTKVKTGEISFKINNKDSIEFKFSKTNPWFKLNDKELNFKYLQGDSIKITGAAQYAPKFQDKLKIIIDSDMNFHDIPSLSFNEISTVEFVGKLWKPSDESPLNVINKCGNLIIPEGDFPFTILADTVNLKINGNTTIHGDIDASKWITSSAKMIVSTNSTEKTFVYFKGYVDSTINIESPYLNIVIDNFISNSTDDHTTQFPVGFSFNENITSHIQIKNISFKNKPSTKANSFACFPSIITIYTDEGLAKFPLLINGFEFLDLPADSMSSKSFKILVSESSPSAVKGIPGFTVTSICMDIRLDNKDRLKVIAYKAKEAYGSPAYICIMGSRKCNNPPGIKAYPFSDIKEIVDGDISKYVSAGYKSIYISATTAETYEIELDFDKLKNTNYTITIDGSTVSYIYPKFSILASEGKVFSYSINHVTLYKGVTFNADVLDLMQVKFTKPNLYKFGSAKITADAESIDSINSVSQTINMKELYIVHNYAYFKNSGVQYASYEESVNVVNENSIEFCATGYYLYFGKKLNEIYKDDYGTSVCCTINPKYVKKIKCMIKAVFYFDVTSLTENINPVEFVVSPLYKESSIDVILGGDGWGTADMKNKFKINQGKKGVALKVTKPGQAKNIEFNGKGQVLFTIDYGKVQEYCFYKLNSTISCKDKLPNDKIKIQFDETFNEKLLKIDKNSINANFDNKEEAIQIPLSFLNNKKVSLTTTYGFQFPQEIEFDFDTKLDHLYSMTTFEFVKLNYNKTDDVVATFGQFKIANQYFKVNDLWKQHVTLNTSQLICTYEQLTNFKNITINDQLIVTGAMSGSIDDVVIDFDQDDDPNDLVADIGGDVHIFISKGAIRIGKYTFKITHSENYDVYFKVIKPSNITVELTESITKADFTKIIFDCQAIGLNITFIGDFPVLDDNEDSLIMIKGAVKANNKLNVTSNSNLPLSVYGMIDNSFHLLSSKITSIQGPIEYCYGHGEFKYGRIRFYNEQEERISINVPRGIQIKTIESSANFTGIASPNLEVTIGKVYFLEEPKSSSKIYFSVVNSIDNKGSSKLTFLEKLPAVLAFTNHTYVITKVYGKIISEESFPFIHKPENIIQARSEDIASMSLSFRYIVDKRENVTHGFYPGVNCLGIKQSEVNSEYHAIQLFAERMPSSIPFVIDYATKGQRTSGELVINEDNEDVLDDLNTLLPNVFVGIIMRLYRDMDQLKPLNLNSIVGGRTSLSITIESPSSTPSKAFITLPQSASLNLSFDNINLGVETIESTKELVADFVNFVDCDFVNANEFKLSSKVKLVTTDVDSLNELVDAGTFSEYKNRIVVNSANVILFTKDGWEFREDAARKTTLIKASDFTNIAFETRRFCILQIDDPTLTSIHSFKFDVFPGDDGTVYFEMGLNWGNVKDLDNFRINVNGAEKVALNTASYPIPKIFDISETNMSYIFIEDTSGKFDVITFPKGKTFKNEAFSVDFQFLQNEYRLIKGEHVIFEGNTSINFKNDLGEAHFDNVDIKEGSNSTFPKIQISKELTIEKGADLYYIGLIDGWPQKLELIYDNETADYELYRTNMMESTGLILMRGLFNCYAMKKNVQYGGRYKKFGEGNTYLDVECDSATDEQLLLLKGKADLDDDEDNQGQAEHKDHGISSGGVAGIVIAGVAIGGIAAFAVYYFQRVKIDRLKNEIPVEKTSAYQDSRSETLGSEVDPEEIDPDGSELY